MKRIDIEEIGVEVLTRPQPSGQSKVAQQITAREAQLFDSLLSSNPPQPSGQSKVAQQITAREAQLFDSLLSSNPPQPSGQSKVAQQITAREAQLFDSLLSSNPPQTSANERPYRDTDTISTAQLNSVKSGKDDQGQSEQTQSPLL
ncbi:hypothetical protein EGW08_012694 [Elysia chlorotica]|uniref:Uncharacterized protein n=1 Tax=Elysia chlorotica TaxID=188477 RepID=A0A433TDN8_ELYCH|nr:hypothetical protein EGW08_012694 [Elysia chlorotica]